MAEGYIVEYHLGSKNGQVYKLWIYAHDKEEAKRNCIMQAGMRHGYSYKVTINNVKHESEGNMNIEESDPKEIQTVSMSDIYQSIIDANLLLSKEFKAFEKIHRNNWMEKIIKSIGGK